MSETLAEAVERIVSQHAGDLAWVRKDNTRTEEYKIRELGKIHLRMRDEIAAARENIEATRVSRVRQLTRRLFGTEGLPGDSASLAISQRDAGDRVASVDSQRGLMELLERATPVQVTRFLPEPSRSGPTRWTRLM